jgi:thiamine pyrophosphate-dependent acetolactate synthase large subunit-like protein
MKLMLPFLSVVVLATACSNPKTDADVVKTTPATITADTTGLAQFQAWKAQNELAALNEYKAQAVTAAPVQKRTRTTAPVRRAVSTQPVATQSGTMTSETANTAKAAEKRGWSKAAKGAAIGAGTGAVIGAVVNKKNRVAGGVIGGVAGGAVGYGIGRHIDKRDGRY